MVPPSAVGKLKTQRASGDIQRCGATSQDPRPKCSKGRRRCVQGQADRECGNLALLQLIRKEEEYFNHQIMSKFGGTT